MKIVIISNLDRDWFYGGSTRPYFLSVKLAELGHQVLHLCRNPPTTDHKNLTFRAKKASSSGPGLLRRFAHVYNVYKLARDFGPDVIVGEQTMNQYVALLLGWLLRKAAVYDAHSSKLLEKSARVPATTRLALRLREKLLLSLSRKVVVVSPELRDFFVSSYGLQAGKLALVTNGTDLRRPAAGNSELKRQLGIGDADKTVVFICPRNFASNIEALHFFFTIVPLVEKEFKRVKFLIIGGGEKIPPPSENVIYTGFVDQLADYLCLGDVAVAPYPATALCGGTRNKVADYLVLGLPMVSTAEGVRGFAELQAGKHYLSAEEPADFARDMVRVLSDSSLASALATEAMIVSERYSWDRSAREFDEVLRSI